MRKTLISFLLLLLSMQILPAQQILVVKKRNPNRKYVYKEQNSLKVRLKSNRQVLKGPWQFVNDSSFVLDGRLVALQDIYWIDISKKERGIWILRKGQDMLVLVGLGLFGISLVNKIIQPQEFKIEDKVYTKSANMIAGGLIFRGLDRTLRPRKVRVGRKFSAYLR